MRKLILACDDSKLASKIKQALAVTKFHISYTCISGAEALARASSLSGGIILCARLSDMPVETLESLLPCGFEMILLLYPGQIYQGNSTALNMPVRGTELLKAIEVFATAWDDDLCGDYQKINRNEDEKNIIEKAKALLMQRENIKEEEAHRLLQKHSMLEGKKLSDIARKILSQ